MKLRTLIPASGLILLLLATTGVKGCREETARTFNPNRAPNTYLTGAPIETTTVNYLFHMYWGGTDPDGEVVGYYLAVTDSTMPTMEPNPDSLVWTTRTDTSIAFRVAGTKNTLSQRFYVWAVDNEGRVDPSPAWVFFDVWDHYFPEPIFLESQGIEYRKDGTQNVFPITDAYAEDGVRDTVPILDPLEMDSVLVSFRWTGKDRDRFGFIAGFRYRITGDAGVTEILGVDTSGVRYRDLGNGVMKFFLSALDDAGAQTDPESTRVFVSNFDPDTWVEPEFTEFRPVKGETLEIAHQEGDTVAIGSTVEFCVRSSDRDGDDSAIQYSYHIITKKLCGGGSVPPFTFFDTENTGPRQCFTIQIDRSPAQSGLKRFRVRTKDIHGRVDSTPAEFLFNTNLPPTIPLNLVRLNKFYTIQSGFVRLDGDKITVTLAGAEDPDPGNGKGALEAHVRLVGEDPGSTYDSSKGWGPANAPITLTGISPGRYGIEIKIRDEGCRELVINHVFDARS